MKKKKKKKTGTEHVKGQDNFFQSFVTKSAFFMCERCDGHNSWTQRTDHKH